MVKDQEKVRTNNPERPAGAVDIHTTERTNAGAADVEDVVRALEGVRLAAKVKDKLREGGNVVTRKRIGRSKSAWHQSFPTRQAKQIQV